MIVQSRSRFSEGKSSELLPLHRHPDSDVIDLAVNRAYIESSESGRIATLYSMFRDARAIQNRLPVLYWASVSIKCLI